MALFILSLEFFCKNSIYLHVRLRERFVNPQLLKQLAVYKIIELIFYILTYLFAFLLKNVCSILLKLCKI